MKNVLVIPFLLLGLCVYSQEKLFSVADATGLNPSLIPSNLSQLQWMEESNAYAWVSGSFVIQGHVKTTQRDTILHLDTLNRVLKLAGVEPLKKFPDLSFRTPETIIFSHACKVWSWDRRSEKLTMLNKYPEYAKHADIHETMHNVAYTRDNSLFVSIEGVEIPVAESAEKGILYGSDRVHRNEWGISKGTFWSPAGRYLAFYRMDERQVTEYPLVKIDPRIAVEDPTRYPMAGMTSHKVTVGIYDVASKTVVYLKTTPTSAEDPALGIEYLTNVTWSPDEKAIYIAVLNRDQNHMSLNKYDVATGECIKTLFTEKDNAYVEPLHGPEFLNGDAKRFIWESSRDGFNHLYLYDDQGNLIRQLTSGNWVVTELLGPDAKGEKVFFTCNRENPLDRYLYYTDVKKNTLIPVIQTPGTHQPKISHDGNFILDSHSSIAVSREIRLLDGQGRVLQVLLENRNPLKDYKLGETAVFTIPNEDQTELFCRMIKPSDFDSSRKYPVIIYVYGGPHSQLVTDTWLAGAGLTLNYLAQQGYVVFTLDNRGTSARGKAFEQAIFRNVGSAEVADQMCGVRYLKSLSWVDTTRIGINGWSYGGFMTISMMLKHPGTFKVAVAGGPVTDWKYYEVMYGERYMDTPETNPDGYAQSSLLNKADKLQGRLLIIHGYQDETVVPQNSLTFLKRCVEEGKQVDFFFYPGHEHNVRGKDRAHMNQKILQYFNDFL